jgi:S1-C subfamily serine protease
VITGSPAARAGLRPRDLIVCIADRRISTVDDLHRFLDENPIGSLYEIEILREGRRLALRVQPEEPRD